MSAAWRTVVRAALVAVLLMLTIAVSVLWLNVRGEDEIPAAAASASLPASPQLIERGAYLARAANCAACHTDRGGAAYAGGKGIATPFGTVYASNLTPDGPTGIGSWSPAHFWRALHNGRSKSGRLLYPAFPYNHYTLVTRDDADALFAFLRSQQAVSQPNKAHELRYPYNTQAALAMWRALYFRPGAFVPQAKQSADWNRGAYLVRGLGHCAACHAPRNALGATVDELSGGLMPGLNWVAPSLLNPHEAGVATWQQQQVVELLKTGVTQQGSTRGATLGPMAEVVYRSTQHLTEADLRAMAVYLQGLPRDVPRDAPLQAVDPTVQALGAQLYKTHCAACHGERGEGAAPAYPALAGNRKVTMASPVNLVQMILRGGFLPTTAGNPRPYGMPPFGQTLNDAEIAALATHVRSAWGNAAAPVSALDVLQLR